MFFSPSAWLLICLSKCLSLSAVSVTPPSSLRLSSHRNKDRNPKTKHDNWQQHLKHNTGRRRGVRGAGKLKDFHILMTSLDFFSFNLLENSLAAPLFAPYNKELRSSDHRLCNRGIKLSAMKVFFKSMLFFFFFGWFLCSICPYSL